jgi:hypothetical protein
MATARDIRSHAVTERRRLDDPDAAA